MHEFDAQGLAKNVGHITNYNKETKSHKWRRATARYKKQLTRNVKKYREYLLKRQVQGKEL